MSLSARTWALDLNMRPRLDDEPGHDLLVPLKPGEKLVLVVLGDFESPDEGYAFPSYQKLAEKSCMSLRSVKTHVLSLRRYGLIRIEKHKTDGQWENNTYYFDEVGDEYRERDTAWCGKQWGTGAPALVDTKRKPKARKQTEQSNEPMPGWNVTDLADRDQPNTSAWRSA